MKVLFAVVTFFILINIAQGADSSSVQNETSQNSSVKMIEDEELIIGDDEDPKKASQKIIVDTVAPKIPSKEVDNAKKEKKSIDGELKLDGGEESLFESAKSKKDTTSNDSIVSGGITPISTDQKNTTDSVIIGGGEKQDRSVEVNKPDEPVLSVNEPSKIEKTSSINFARNLKEYRSPKVAMLLSLFVPGAGQVYARHNSWKAAIFGAVEVGMIATSVGLHFKGKEKEKEAFEFADSYYSYDRYQKYQDSVLKRIVPDSVYKNIFIGDADISFKEAAASKNRAYYKDYILERDQPFVYGWYDVRPHYDDIVMSDPDYKTLSNPDSSYLVYPKGGDSTKFAYGFSKYQENYYSQISDARKNFRDKEFILTLMLINHIVSAIDAGFTAKAHNDKLLNKESFWHRINLDQMYVATGNGVIPGYALKVRF